MGVHFVGVDERDGTSTMHLAVIVDIVCFVEKVVERRCWLK